jgi:hypothetical protein
MAMHDILKTGLPSIAALSLLLSTPAAAVETKAAPRTESVYHQQINRLLPVAWWSFDQKRADLGETEGALVFGKPGPKSARFKSFTDNNLAAAFGGDSGKKGGVIKVEDPGPGSQFDFDNGDPITIEAWVNPDKDIRAGSTMYILGKGRTNNRGQEANNQNYGFRVFRSGDAMLLSFLFRSRTVGAHKSDWHRWDSSQGFSVGSGWHHIAVTYVFGKPDSIRGYVDGEPVQGGWSPAYAGATTQPPVVDDDEIWVGSSMGRGAGASFQGLMDEVALYRRALTEEQLTQRHPLEPYQPKFTDGAPSDRVRVEIVENLGKTGSWPKRFGKPSLTYDEEAFGFFQTPEKYTENGVRDAWTNPFLIRAASRLILPPGEHEWLLRVRGKGRLWLDGKVIAEIDYGRFGGGAHNDVHEEVAVKGADLRYLGPGDREQLVKVTGDGKEHLVVLEMIAGNGRVRATLGETSLSARQENGGFALLSPGPREVPLSDGGWEAYRRERMAYHREADRARRVALRATEADYWQLRHSAARETIAKKEPLAHHDIDSFLEASWSKANAETAKASTGVSFARQIKPILGEQCYRCHDQKAKGGLRLSSREAALKGGDSEEPAFVPGKPEASRLLKLIHPDAGDDIMPPKGTPLTKGERDLLSQWILEGASYAEAGKQIIPAAKTDDLEFLRRVTLDTVGVVPNAGEIETFLNDSVTDRRAKAIDRLLADSRWADHWTAYWQDVLAENPNILKPSLNNSGPFRFWIHEALEDNLPMDRFVTELVLMQGNAKAGGPAGFALAAQNDVPMAAKAHILGTAFLGVEMKCARCHDAPYHESKQSDLFQLAAMLNRDPIKLPASSSVPLTTFAGRKPLIEITLKPGSTVNPDWPSRFAEQFLGDIDTSLLRTSGDTREELAALITAPGNRRFSRVIVNRLWKQFMGAGFVDPVDDWEASKPTQPELLEWLARELVANGYDQKHVARLILNSAAYQRRALPLKAGTTPDFSAPIERRMTAEQVVDSLFLVAGKPLVSEELTMDNDGTQNASAMISLGHPRRAWEFTSLSNERDRPSLAIPKAQAIVDVLENFGWRPSRQEPKSIRENSPNVRQPAVVANGSLSVWVTTLSEDHAITALATRPDITPDELVEKVFLRVLTREPSGDERRLYTELLGKGFDQRIVPEKNRPPITRRTPLKHVSWSNHLSEEANRIKIELEQRAREGDPPTVALRSDWRERMEDMLWSLMNSPEFVYLP